MCAVLPNRLLLYLISSSAFKAYYNMLKYVFKTSFIPNREQEQRYRLLKKSLLSNPSTETDKQEQEQEQEEEEEEEGANENPSSFFRFLKTLVVHFTAKRALEKHVLQVPNEGINFSLVERSALAIPNGSWSTMEDMIRELFSSEDHSSTLTDVTATKAVEILKW